jgi:hypothetical protein
MRWEEVKQAFGSFSSSDRRPRLFEQLDELFTAVSAVDFVRFLILNGSFISAKPAPGDVDIIIVVDAGALAKASWSPTEYNILSSKRLRKRYEFDVFVVPEGSAAYRYYLEFFSRVKGADARKGVVKVDVRATK